MSFTRIRLATQTNKSMGGANLTDLGDPIDDQDAATKSYVDDATPTLSWGSITGTLSSQTDLQSALDDKVSKATGATPETLNEVIALLQATGLCS